MGLLQKLVWPMRLILSPKMSRLCHFLKQADLLSLVQLDRLLSFQLMAEGTAFQISE